MLKDEFLKVYNSSNTFEEAVERTGLSHRTVIQYAGELRKQGVEVKKFEREKQKKIDLDILITAWNSSSDLKEVVEKTHYSFNTIMRYVTGLRSLGVSLKNLGRRFNEDNFVSTWQKSASIDEVVEKLELKKSAVRRYYKNLKDKYNLKEFLNKSSIQTFLEICNTSNSIMEVANKLNITPSAVWLRRKRLHDKGYEFKELKWNLN